MKLVHLTGLCFICVVVSSLPAFAQTVPTPVNYGVGLQVISSPERFTEDATAGVPFTLTVTNLGARPDTIELETDSDAPVTAELSRGFVTLESGESATFQLTVMRGDNIPGRYPVTVKGNSRGDQAQVDSVTVTMIVVEPQVLSITFDFDETQPIRTFFLANRASLVLKWQASGPEWVITAPSSGEFSNGAIPIQIEVDFDRLPQGTHHGRLQFIDTERSDNTQAILLNVNRRPRFKPIAPQRIAAGGFIEFIVSATDADLDIVTLGVDSLPDGAIFDATTGLFSWQTQERQVGRHILAFQARDDFQNSGVSELLVEIEVFGDLEFTLRLFSGATQMVHIPVADSRFRRVSDLFTFLQPQVEAIIFFDPASEIFRAYTHHSRPNSSTDLILEPWTGLVISNRFTAPSRDVVFRGPPYTETDIPLKRGILTSSGINLIGLPVRDARIRTLTDLSLLHPNIINVIGKTPLGNFRDAPADDFLITGGQSFVALVRVDTTLLLNGEGWDNRALSDSSIASAPTVRGFNPPAVAQPLASILHQLRATLQPTALLPNYPNPFNPETWLPFHLAEDAQVSLQIYSIAGKIVRTLDLGWQSSGVHLQRSEAAYWDGRNSSGEKVTSGVYFYTMRTRNRAGQFEGMRSPYRLVVLK
ncbi:MAG: hypothetical protein O7E52_06310 [Candidatus Poribacteria bacterium]|nr:hypothetical protein [Candidatus Poribacteria bacterium]